MSLELNSNDDQNALSEMTNQHAELQEEFDVLTEQINSIVSENEKLQSTVKVLDSKVSLTEDTVEELQGEKHQLLEEVENLQASQGEVFASSEKAVVVSQADQEINEERTRTGNEFLTDEVMKFMPFSQS
jgi:peptidoglycan hydrolase CwlO-like protein